MTAMTQTHETPMLSLRAAVRPGSVDIENRTAELTWTTGAKGRRWSWDIGAYMEELEVTPEAVRLDRLNNGAPFLNTHSAWELGDVVGVVERAWLEGGAGTHWSASASARMSSRSSRTCATGSCAISAWAIPSIATS